MRYLAISLLLAASVASAKEGRYHVNPSSQVDLPEEPWVRCSTLPDPAVSTTALTTATSSSDLHADIMAACGSGCIVTLAAGTYDGNVVFGDAALKAGSITPSAEVVIRGADRSNPPVIRATPDLKAAVVHAKNVTARIRIEDVILDGRRTAQTSAGATTVCTDTTPANSICDTGSQTSTFLNGFNTRSTIAGQTSSCLLRVQVRETVDTGIQLSQPFASTVEDSTVSGSGCTTALCPAMSIPADAFTNSVLKTAMGIQFSGGSDSAVIDSSIYSVTKIGIECFTGMRRCHLYRNSIDSAFSAGITFNDADGEIVGNSVTSTGMWLSPNGTSDNAGNGITFTSGDTYAATGFGVRITGNTVTRTRGSGIQLGLASPTKKNYASFVVSQNTVTDTCVDTTRSDAAALELGDSAQDFSQVIADRNASTSTGCPDGIRIRNLTEFRGWSNSTTGGVEIDDVDGLDLRDISITGNLDVDVDTLGKASNCSLTGSIVGAANIVRSNCGA